MIRQLYCVVAMPTTVEFQMEGSELVPTPAVPMVVGPFKTTVQARNAGARDWDGRSDIRWIVLPLYSYSDAQDRLVTMTYDRMLDPGVRSRCLACKQTIKESV